MTSLDSFKCRKSLKVGSKTYSYFSLKAAEQNGLAGISKLPVSLKVLLENLLRHEDGRTVTKADIKAMADWLKKRGKDEREIAFRPARVLMQDFTGVPAVVDLAAMRDAMKKLGKNPDVINPLAPVDLVIDHSVMVDFFANSKAFAKNVDLEYDRNGERYTFLKWGQGAFDNFRVVPPGTGICHQVNLEYLAKNVWSKKEKVKAKTVEVAFPDTLVGTDSHTTMVNGLAVLGWGVGGIEAEAAMLGQPISMLIPEVIGFKLTGKRAQGTTATDLVLTVTQMLRKKGVVGKFVEFYGPGLAELSLEDMATIANMAPEYGATCGFFPTNGETISYMKGTGRPAGLVGLVEKYAKTQGMFWNTKTPDPVFTDSLSLDLGSVQPSIAGPKRPQDRVTLPDAASGFAKVMTEEFKKTDLAKRYKVDGANFDLGHGDVVIAAITSCTNTSNPSVMVGARRGNHEVMMRGTYANIRIKNQMVPGVEGGVTIHQPSGKQMPIYDAAMQYEKEKTPLIIFAGREYGTGSSRDWAAKGTKLLGVRAVVAQSFERIHRSNLIGMGVVPLQFKEGESWQSLGLNGAETITILGLEKGLKPRQKLVLEITSGAKTRHVEVLCRIDTLDEIEYFKHGGILPYVMRNLAAA